MDPDEIRVVVVKARELAQRKKERGRAYVVFGVSGVKLQTQKVLDPLGNPIWNEEGVFKVKKPDDVLKMTIYEKDHVLGQILHPVEDMGNVNEYLVLPLTAHSSKKMTVPVQGEIHFNCQIINYKYPEGKHKHATLSNLKDKLTAPGRKINGAQSMYNISDSISSVSSSKSSKIRKPFSKLARKFGSSSALAQSEGPMQMMSPMSKSTLNLESHPGDRIGDAGEPQPTPESTPLPSKREFVPTNEAESDGSSLPGSAASMERRYKKNSNPIRKIKKFVTDPSALEFSGGVKHGLDDRRSQSLLNLQDLPVESLDAKVAHHYLSPESQSPEVDENNLAASSEHLSEQKSNTTNRLHSRFSSSPNLLDSGIDMRLDMPSSLDDLRSSRCSSTQLLFETGFTPVITNLIPHRGSHNGGTKLVIVGHHFGSSERDIFSVKVCGCDVRSSLNFISPGRLEVTTRLWREMSGKVVVETRNGQAISASDYTFVNESQLTRDATDCPIPAKILPSETADRDKSFSGKNLLPDLVHPSVLLNSNQDLSQQSKLRTLPPTRQNHLFNRKSSDRYRRDIQSGSKKELQDEIYRLRKIVSELTDKNIALSEYVDTLVAKVMNTCPELLMKVY